MGITTSASARRLATDKTKTPKTLQKCSKTNNCTNETTINLVELDEDKETSQRKQRLLKILRSKISAMEAFRSTIRATSGSQESGEGDDSDGLDDGDGVGQSNGRLRSLDILYHPNQNREELQDFLWKTRKATGDCWDGIVNDERDMKERYSIHERKRATNVPDEDRLPPFMSAVDNDLQCDLCHKVTVFSMACRICTRVYHHKCLQRSGRYNDSDKVYMDRANTDEGWSCFNCDNLCSLLTAAETAEMMEDFDEYDINRDERISLEEFQQFKRHQYELLVGSIMPEEEELLVRAQFEWMDTDRSMEIDWNEFMRFEARRFLARKSESDLYEMLSQKELLQARDVYLRSIKRNNSAHAYFQGVIVREGVSIRLDKCLQNRLAVAFLHWPAKDECLTHFHYIMTCSVGQNKLLLEKGVKRVKLPQMLNLHQFVLAGMLEECADLFIAYCPLWNMLILRPQVPEGGDPDYPDK